MIASGVVKEEQCETDNSAMHRLGKLFSFDMDSYSKMKEDKNIQEF
jgi:hypothetical protein